MLHGTILQSWLCFHIIVLLHGTISQRKTTSCSQMFNIFYTEITAYSEIGENYGEYFWEFLRNTESNLLK